MAENSGLDAFFDAISAPPPATPAEAPWWVLSREEYEAQKEASSLDTSTDFLESVDAQAKIEYTEIPTSSSFPARPRTVAAWWEPYHNEYNEGTLFVVFRDGTPWQYEDVPEGVWIGFKNSISKGQGFLNPAGVANGGLDGELLLYPNGPASVALPRGVKKLIKPEKKYNSGSRTYDSSRWSYTSENVTLTPKYGKKPKANPKSAPPASKAPKRNTSAQGPKKKK